MVVSIVQLVAVMGGSVVYAESFFQTEIVLFNAKKPKPPISNKALP